MCRKAVSLCLCFSMVLALAVMVPGHAHAVDYVSTPVSYWDHLIHYLVDQDDSGAGGFLGDFVSSSVCSLSPDKYHHADSLAGSMIDRDGNGIYAVARCKYCGVNFKYYSSDYAEAYGHYVGSLPSAEYSLDESRKLYFRDFVYGEEAWIPSVNLLYPEVVVSGKYGSVGAEWQFYSPSVSTSSTVYLDPCARSALLYVPYDGLYTFYNSELSQSRIVFTNGTVRFSLHDSNGDIIAAWNTEDRNYELTAGYYYVWFGTRSRIAPGAVASISSAPYLYYHGDSGPVSNVYPEGSRSGNITYNIAVDSSTYTDVSIFNETTNIYYNPSTNEEHNVTNWVFNYETMTYELTLSDGTIVELYFGDDGIVINHNGVFEYQYISGDDHEHDYELTDSVPPTCGGFGTEIYTCTQCGDVYQELIPMIAHVFTEVYTAPSCTANGLREYVCTICGEVESEVVFALGHDYELKESTGETVIMDETALLCPSCDGSNVVYVLNEDGKNFDCSCSDCSEAWQIAGVIVPASELYCCSRCGDEYTVTNGEGVPPSGNTGFWSWLQNWLINFKEWLGEKFDGLGGAGESGDTIINQYDENININEGDSYDYDVTYTDEDGEEQSTSLRDIVEKFGFLRDVYTIGETLFAAVAADSSAAYSLRSGGGIMTDGVPSITVDLGAADSAYGITYGGVVPVLDLSWYAEYKPTVDNIISGFLWLLFLWGVFKQAPNIISGAGMVSNKGADLAQGVRVRR